MTLLAKINTTTLFDSSDISNATKSDYIATLPHFLKFVHSEGVTRDLLLNYKKSLREDSTVSISTKNKRLCVARLTLREMYRQGYISVDLSQGVKSFEQSNRHKVSGLDRDEVARVFRYLATQQDGFRTSRLQAIFTLLTLQGLRTIEICRLNVNDIDVQSSLLLVRGKGREDKEPIHLHPSTTKALTAYLKQSHVKDGALFYPINRSGVNLRLTTRGLRKIIRSMFNELDIHKTVHGSRHFFTTELIKSYKGDLTTVARYTRHRSLETLNVYNDSIIQKEDLPRFYSVFESTLSE